MRKWIFVISLIVFCSLGVMGLLKLYYSPDVNTGKQVHSDEILNIEDHNSVTNDIGYGKAKIGGEFSLLDQHGNNVTDQDLLGHYVLITFGFSNCPHICPANLTAMTDSINLLPIEIRDSVIPVFITVDPSRDTVEHLSKFIQSYHKNFLALTGSEENIAKAITAYRIYAHKNQKSNNNEALDNEDDYEVDHSSIIYFIGKNAQYLTHFSFGEMANNMAQKMMSYIK